MQSRFNLRSTEALQPGTSTSQREDLLEIRHGLCLCREKFHYLENIHATLFRLCSILSHQLETQLGKESGADNRYFDDLLSKLSEDEFWTLQILCDFRRVTLGALEELLGFADRLYVIHQLAPLEQFGLVKPSGRYWRPTWAGRGVVNWRQKLIREGKI